MSAYLLDTNVVSEATRSRPHPNVLSFLESVRGAQKLAYISVLTIGELRRGAAAKRASDERRADRLAKWVDDIEAEFSDRILPVDRAVARIWGEFSAKRSLPVVDTLIAATALAHDLTVVTRNVRDMSATGVSILNPWSTG